MKRISLLSGCAGMILSGCATPPPEPPPPSETNRFELEASLQICQVDALAEEKQAALSTSNDVRRSIEAYQNKFGAYDETTGSILQDKLYRYEAEIEASYRFVTQHCGAYMRCLERNFHDEWRCKGLETQWSDSQDKFNALSAQIRSIAAQVEIERIKAASRRKGPRPQQHGGSCCTTLNNVFTDCCQ